MADVATLIVKVVSDVKGATAGLDEVTSRSDKMKKGLSTAAKVATGVLVGLGAAAVSAGNAAAEDAQSQAILATALKNSAGASTKAIASTEAWIAAQAAATGVADDQLRPALGNLVRATGDVGKSQDALKVAMDVSAATGKDLESVSAAIAKGYGGQTTAIGRLVPGLDKATLASGDMSAVMDELAAKTGGSAAAAADTAAGQMAIMTNSMNEAKESIGAGLLPIMEKFAGALAKVGTFAQQHSTSFQVIAVAIAALAVATIAANAALSISTAVTGAWAAAQLLANSTLGIRIGLLAISTGAWLTATAATIANTVATIAQSVASTALAAGLAVVTAAQWLWNAAMTANPIGIVILAIVALVAIIVIAYKKSETFRAIVDALWAAMKSGASAVASVVGAAFSAILNAIQTAFGWVKSNWPTILAILTGPIGIAVALIVKNWDKIESAFKAVTDKIDSLWSSTVGALKSAVSGLGALLSAPFDAAKSAVQSLIDLVQGLINKISGIHFPKIPGPLAGLLSVPAPPQSVAVSRSAAPAVPVVGSRAVATGGGITINVTGAIDPEATARQIERVLIGHTRRTGFAT